MDKARADEFPAPSRRASGVIQGIGTEVVSLSFSDKFMITISQEGRLSQWIQVPLTSSSAGAVDITLPSLSRGVLPSTHLTPTTLLGAGGDDRESSGQLYAAQIASHLTLKYPSDRRVLIVGLGLGKFEDERAAFFDVFDLALQVL